jgi:hypothetical protein
MTQIQNIEILNTREIELLDKNRKINLQKLFTEEGINFLIDEIKKEVADFSADISTKEGRQSIISMAHKVAKCKSPIKNLATELKEDSKKFIDSVNLQWNRYEKEMDTLRDSIRKPVDEIEEKEAKILKEKQDRIAEIQKYKNIYLNSSKLIEQAIDNVNNLAVFEWADFQFIAENLVNETLEILNNNLIMQKKNEADAAELEKLRKEKEEREKKDAEERIRKEAEERAKKEAEEKIKRAEQAKIDAENRAKELEKLKIENEKKAKENAERMAKEAVEKERLRIAEEERKKVEEEEKRQANKRHRQKIENEIFDKLKEIFLKEKNLFQNDLNDDLINKLIESISKNEVPNLKIIY